MLKYPLPFSYILFVIQAFLLYGIFQAEAFLNTIKFRKLFLDIYFLYLPNHKCNSRPATKTQLD